MWSLQFAASNIGGKCSPTSLQRLSAGCRLGLLLSPSSPLTLSFCWSGCAVRMCLLGIFGVWDGGFIPCASSQALACGSVLTWGAKLGSWGVSAWEKLPWYNSPACAGGQFRICPVDGMKMQMEIRESLTMGTREIQLLLCYLKCLFNEKLENVLFVRDTLSLCPPGLVFTSWQATILHFDNLLFLRHFCRNLINFAG